MGALHSHVAIIDDMSVSGTGRVALLHVEVALDLTALDFFIKHPTVCAGDRDADMLRGLLVRGDPFDAVCVFHISDIEPEARTVAQAYAERMMELCEKIHAAVEARERTEVKYVWNESKGTVDALTHASADAPKQRRRRK